MKKRKEGIHIEFSREKSTWKNEEMGGNNEMCGWETEHDDGGPNWLRALTITWLSIILLSTLSTSP
jgi:hypothetical protein